ncbi:MAG: winged helix-turn-helix domain-containing protein [Actinomycetota bacterium]|nr:winged helix-turn-helix domain-containing protein [Actinomycetota bacterium]
MPTISPAPDYEAADTLLVSRPEQLRAVGDALRIKIVSLLRDRARSTQELAEELGLPKGTVGHHLKVLERAGLIQVVRTRKVRALTEKYYGRVARLFLFQPEDSASARSLGAGALRQAADELERAPAWANFGVVRARLAAADARRLERRLDRLIEDFRRSEVPDGRLFVFANALWPAESDA